MKAACTALLKSSEGVSAPSRAAGRLHSAAHSFPVMPGVATVPVDVPPALGTCEALSRAVLRSLSMDVCAASRLYCSIISA